MECHIRLGRIELTCGNQLRLLKKKDRAIVVLLESLEGNVKAEKAVQDLKASEINIDDGM